MVVWSAGLPPTQDGRERRGNSDNGMATTQNGTGQLESKLVEDQVPLRCPPPELSLPPEMQPLPL